MEGLLDVKSIRQCTYLYQTHGRTLSVKSIRACTYQTDGRTLLSRAAAAASGLCTTLDCSVLRCCCSPRCLSVIYMWRPALSFIHISALTEAGGGTLHTRVPETLCMHNNKVPPLIRKQKS
jgi:hypothetical protein